MMERCTSEEFTKLRNRYTGEPVVTYLVMVGARPMFYAPDTYSTATPFPTAEDAVAAWSRENGIAGSRDRSKGLRCAYTGRPLVPERTPRGWVLAGGFDPTVLHSRESYLAHMSSSGEAPAVPGEQRVEAVPEQVPLPRSREPEQLPGAIEAAESALHAAGVRPETSTVTVPGKAPRRGKARH